MLGNIMRYVEYASIYGNTTAYQFSMRNSCSIEKAIEVLDKAVQCGEATSELRRGEKVYYPQLNKRKW